MTYGKAFKYAGKGISKASGRIKVIGKTRIAEGKFASKAQMTKLKAGKDAYPQLKGNVELAKAFKQGKYAYEKRLGGWHETGAGKIKGQIPEGKYGAGLHIGPEQSRTFLRTVEKGGKTKLTLLPSRLKPTSYWVRFDGIKDIPKEWVEKLKTNFNKISIRS